MTERERGTPHTLLSLWIILPIILGASTAITYFISSPFLSLLMQANITSDVKFIIIALLGASSMLRGILYSSSSMFVKNMCVSVVVGSFISAQSEITMAQVAILIAPLLFASLVVPMLMKSRFVKAHLPVDSVSKRLLFLSSQIAFHQFMEYMLVKQETEAEQPRLDKILMLLCANISVLPAKYLTIVPFFIVGSYFTLQSCMDFLAETGLYPFILYLVGAATLFLLGVFYKYRSHPNGSLHAGDNGAFEEINLCKAALIGVISVARFLISDQQEQTVVFSEYLLGVVFILLTSSVVMLLIATIFASVADNWYVVGTNQFQMCSVDTLGLLFHFVFPVSLLVIRASKMLNLTQLMGGCCLVPADFEGTFHNLTFYFALVSVCGLSILNNLSPLGGYLLAKVYTHGQPSTKKVSVIIQLDELLLDLSSSLSSEEDLLNFSNKLKGKGVSLSVVANVQTMKENETLCKKLIQDGHLLTLSTYHNTFNKNKNIRKELSEGRDYLKKLLTGNDSSKSSPWYFPSSGHKNPKSFYAANKLGMNVCLWSTLCSISSSNISKESICILTLEQDLDDKLGGNFILIQKDASSGRHHSIDFCGAVSVIIDTILEKGYEVAQLPFVAKEAPYMKLK